MSSYRPRRILAVAAVALAAAVLGGCHDGYRSVSFGFYDHDYVHYPRHHVRHHHHHHHHGHWRHHGHRGHHGHRHRGHH